MEYKEALKILGISYSTLRRWVKKEKIRTSNYTFGKYTRQNYWDEDVYAMVGRKVQKENRVVAYCRMNRNTKDSRAKMQEQKRTIRLWCAARGITIDQEIEDWHNGVDYGVKERPGLNEVFQLLMTNKLDAVVVDAEDRLSRLGIELFYELFKYHGVHLLVVNKGITDPHYRDEQSEDIARLLEKARVDRVRQE